MAKFYLNSAKQTYGTTANAGGAEAAYLWPVKVTDGITIHGLYAKLRTAPTGQTAIPVVYDYDTRQLMTQGSAVLVTIEAETYAPMPATRLVAGKNYAIGFYYPNHGNNVAVYYDGVHNAGNVSINLLDDINIQNTGRAFLFQSTGVPAAIPTSVNGWDPHTYGVEYTVSNYQPTIIAAETLADQTGPFTYNYSITDAENNLKSVVVKLNGTIISQLTNTIQGAKSAEINEAQFTAMPYGDVLTIGVDVEDHEGKTASASTTFKRMPTPDLSLLEAVDVINKGMDRVNEKRTTIGGLLSLPEGADFDSIVSYLESSELKKYARGEATPSSGNVTHAYANGFTVSGRYVEVSGLPFRPKVVKVLGNTTAQSQLHFSYMQEDPFVGYGAEIPNGRALYSYFYPRYEATYTRMFQFNSTGDFFKDDGFRIYAAQDVPVSWEAWG